MLHDLAGIVVVTSFAKVMFFPLAYNSSEWVLNQPIILKHTGKLWNLFLNDTLLQLYA